MTVYVDYSQDIDYLVMVANNLTGHPLDRIESYLELGFLYAGDDELSYDAFQSALNLIRGM